MRQNLSRAIDQLLGKTSDSGPARKPQNIKVKGSVEELARLRGECVKETTAYLEKLGRSLVPKSLLSPEKLVSLPIEKTGVEGAFAFVLFEDGRKLYAHPSSSTRLRQYWMIRDKLPKTITPDAFGAVFDVAKRYSFADVSELEGMTGGTVIEAGAYIGLKAMRFADELGPNGRVVAVEIDETNCQIMRRNIEANDLEDRMIPVNAGLWSSVGKFESIANSYQRHSIAQIEKLDGEKTRMVNCSTIDSLIEEFSLEKVDYINVQVNGAELEVLKGSRKHLDRIHHFGITSKYTVDGELIQPQVIEWLESQGFGLEFRDPTKKRIFATRQDAR